MVSRAGERGAVRVVRPWIEPAQSVEKKKRLGLGRRFLNSLRLTWQMSLLAESLVLLRTMAWLDEPQPDGLLSQLQPHQVESDLHLEKLATPENPQITHKSS